MAFYTDTGKSTGLPIIGTVSRQMAQGIDRIRKGYARRAIYNETMYQLSGLTDRDLADIGISRASIQQVARDEARKMVLK
ncbi:MAG: DUF1127 domain-containing protein [Rhodobacteraceae bacterium]|nr:DUF1127 domain-containing protein [Paracoccaceae bacterium]